MQVPKLDQAEGFSRLNLLGPSIVPAAAAGVMLPVLPPVNDFISDSNGRSSSSAPASAAGACCCTVSSSTARSLKLRDKLQMPAEQDTSQRFGAFASLPAWQVLLCMHVQAQHSWAVSEIAWLPRVICIKSNRWAG
jgi:hypothetical protein